MRSRSFWTGRCVDPLIRACEHCAGKVPYFLNVLLGSAQHIGARREQQDNFGFSDTDSPFFLGHGGVLAVLADGMGGLLMGGEASRVARDALLREYQAKEPEETPSEALERALHAANVAVFEASRQEEHEGRIGTTLAAAVIKGEWLYWVAVGDTRIYLYRRGRLIQVTEDHVYAEELYRKALKGEMGLAQIRSHPQKGALTSHLGMLLLRHVDRNFRSFRLDAGDRIMLCSDGLHGAISRQEMVSFLGLEPSEACERMLQKALSKSKPQQDNITVVVMAYEPRRGLG